MLIQSYPIRAIRGKKKLCLFSIDVDDFRSFNNDFEDHAVGDQALVIVADALKKVAVSYNVQAYRRSGDEFVVLGYFESIDQAVECGKQLLRKAHTDIEVTFVQKESGKDYKK